MDYNESTLTTKYVINEKSKVVYVCHSPAGWQFFGKEKSFEDGDIRVISLGNMLKLNPHLKSILWITKGMEAWLSDDTNEWRTGVANYD